MLLQHTGNTLNSHQETRPNGRVSTFTLNVFVLCHIKPARCVIGGAR